MLKNNYNILFGCLIVSIGIILHGYIIKLDTKELLNNKIQYTNSIANKTVFDLTEAAEYLNITEEEVRAIISIETNKLKENGSFLGEMLPYFEIDKKYYFYKEGIDGWLLDITKNHRRYNTKRYEIREY